MNMNEAIDTSSVLRCYTLLALSLPLTFLSFGLISLIATAVFLLTCIWSWRMKRREDALFANHGRWMLRTAGISSLFMLVGLLVSATIISSNADQSAMYEMAALQTSGTGTPEQVFELLREYNRVNFDLSFYSVLGCLALPFAYSLARLSKGYSLADAGKPVENVTTWWI